VPRSKKLVGGNPLEYWEAPFEDRYKAHCERRDIPLVNKRGKVVVYVPEAATVEGEPARPAPDPGT